MTDQAPLVRDVEVPVALVAAAADLTTPLEEVDLAGTVTAVTYSPKSDITGANTDSRTVSLINKGQDGNGTTVIATLAFVSTVNASDYDEKTITLSATPANLVVADGDILAWLSAHVGTTGLADPGGLVKVSISRT